MNDTPPVASTYYSFKQAVYRYHIEQGRDLVEETFKALTKSQAEFFDVDGKKIRMDSKLIGSNIVRCSRLQLAISCLQAFSKSLSEELQGRLDDDRRKVLDELCKKKPNQIVYPLSEEEKSQGLIDLGELLLHLKYHYSIQGTKGSFEFVKTGDGLLVFDKSSDTITEAIEYKDDHYKIKLPGGQWRYFKPE